MAGRAFRKRIRSVAEGEPVSAAVIDRPTDDLQGNLNYILDLLASIQGAESATRHRVSLDPIVMPGQAVFWDVGAQRFAPALAAVAEDPSTGTLELLPSSDCVGICLFKENTTLGDVLLAGYAQVDISAAIQGGGPALPGRYYLSTGRPGMLVRTRPVLSVSVLVADGGGGVYVQPAVRNFLEDHVHYAFRLHACPAGADGGTAVASPDPAKVGWLPADHPSFHDLAPVGAAFGYNLAAHVELDMVWPPLPIGSANLWVDRGGNRLGGTLAPRGTNGLVAIDRDGIWWMSDSPGDIPWLPGATSPETHPPANTADGPESPRLEEMQLTLSFTRMLFATNTSVVTSVQPAAGSPITVAGCTGAPGSTGDLFLGLNLGLGVDPDLYPGGVAFKELVGSTYRRGWVAEGLVAGVSCRLTSTHPQPRGPEDKPYTLHSGEVTVDLATAQGEVEYSPEVERLGDARQRYYQDVPYIALDPDLSAAIRYVFDMPPEGLPPGPLFRLRLRVLGDAGGALPGLTATYRIIPRPMSGLPVALPVMGAERVLGLPLAGTVISSYQYVEAQSEPVAIAPGDTVLVLLARARGDGYAGAVGILRAGGVVAATPPPAPDPVPVVG
jgi:hypothetical protein